MAKTSGLSIDYENSILNHVLRNTSLDATTPYVALYSTDPTDGDIGNEINGSGYTRIQTTGSILPFAIGTQFSDYGTAATNASPVIFGTANEDWGWVTHFGLRTSASGGTLIFYGAFSSGSVYIQKGDIFSINAYAMVVGISTIYQYFAYSSYLENELLHRILNSGSFSSPGSSVYASLYTTMPDRDDSGGIEISGSVGYSRQPCGGASYWNAPSSGCTTNAQSLMMCEKSPVEWETIEGMCLRTSASGGDLLLSGFRPSSHPIEVSPGDGVTFTSGAIRINQWVQII
jgi:hypothetical protein